MTANWFATFAIFGWPIVAFCIYRALPFNLATLSNILGALLLLPSGAATKFEMIPAFDKVSVPNLCAFVACFLFAPRIRRDASSFGIVGCLAALYLFSPVITAVLNGDPIVVGNRFLPGVGYYDGISALLSQSIYFLPFFIGRRFLRDSTDSVAILRVLVVAALLYSLPMLLEVRMSPQLSNWIYGYAPSDFAHDVRYGGYRPMVFMINGLATSFFVATAFLAALALWRAKVRVLRLPAGGINVYLGVIVVLCKSAGALAYSVSAGACVAFLKPRSQVKIAAVIVAIALLYPTLRTVDLFPSNTVLDFAAFFDAERAASLKFRFNQEDMLLAHANERPLFGWGRYGRNRIYSSSGDDISTTDGLWIITLGQLGFFGFLAQFGLLAMPVFRALASLRFVTQKRDAVVLGALTLIVALTIVEQIPNASISPWSWLLAGALLGRAEALRATSSRRLSSLQMFPKTLSSTPDR
jgi:hypothetical protein